MDGGVGCEAGRGEPHRWMRGGASARHGRETSTHARVRRSSSHRRRCHGRRAVVRPRALPNANFAMSALHGVEVSVFSLRFFGLWIPRIKDRARVARASCLSLSVETPNRAFRRPCCIRFANLLSTRTFTRWDATRAGSVSSFPHADRHVHPPHAPRHKARASLPRPPSTSSRPRHVFASLLRPLLLRPPRRDLSLLGEETPSWWS